MKIACTLENFKKAVNNTKNSGKQITLPILGNILMKRKRKIEIVSH
jgi:hypothetical protein